MLEILIIPMISGLITVAIAGSRDRNKVMAFISGFIFGIFAWLYYAISAPGSAKCPKCKSRIRSDATACKNCGSTFDKPDAQHESFKKS